MLFIFSCFTDSAYPLQLGLRWFFPVPAVYPILIFHAFLFPLLKPRLGLSTQVRMLPESQAPLRSSISFAHNSNLSPNQFQFSTSDSSSSLPKPFLIPVASSVSLPPSSYSGPTPSQLWWRLRPSSHFHSLPSLLLLYCETPESKWMCRLRSAAC